MPFSVLEMLVAGLVAIVGLGRPANFAGPKSRAWRKNQASLVSR